MRVSRQKKSPIRETRFQGKRETEALSKNHPAKTNKRVSQQRENILKLTDVSSPRICHYSSCQGPLQRLGHRLAAALACDRAPESLGNFWFFHNKRRACLLVHRGQSLLAAAAAAALPPSLFCHGLTATALSVTQPGD